MMSRDIWLGIGIGALAAFVADPRAGRRRRALARDQLVRASRKTRDALDATAHDLANRTSGMMATTRGRWTNQPADDRRLAERVRAALGRVCSHPHAIDVEATDGRVTLRGPILASEGVRGVASVANALEAHDSAEGIPALQGEGRIAGPSLDILQRNWAPATQALVTAGLAATGICIAAYARR
jgi:gas vesicle protein